MKTLYDYKEEIHSCSKCGLCQSVCPIYKITGNDCTVSRGHFIMLRGFLKGELKMTKSINRYLNLCLKCGACSKFCPSEIDIVEIVALAKSEYFKKHVIEKFISWFQKTFIFGFALNLLAFFSPKSESKQFKKKVIYFGGCGGKITGNKSVVKLLNALSIEVISPNFECCGIPYYVRGDIENYRKCAENFTKKIREIGITEIVTTCASCEKTVKSYKKLFPDTEFNVKNIFEYIRENNFKTELKKNTKVTFHKPCNINNFENIEWILNNTKNLEYVKMEEFDKCCGLNGITKLTNTKSSKSFSLTKEKIF